MTKKKGSGVIEYIRDKSKGITVYTTHKIYFVTVEQRKKEIGITLGNPMQMMTITISKKNWEKLKKV